VLFKTPISRRCSYCVVVSHPVPSTLQQDVFDKEKFSKEDSKKNIKGSEAQNNKIAKLLLHRDVLQGDAYRDIPCHVVSVCGKQGVMKSMDPLAVDRAFSQLVAPAFNVLSIH
jgi:hypothetical protein